MFRISLFGFKIFCHWFAARMKSGFKRSLEITNLFYSALSLTKSLMDYSSLLATPQIYTGKKVILRTCLNVPLDENGEILDDTRLVEALPFIQELAEQAERVVIIGHLGRPKGAYDEKQSFKTVQQWLQTKMSSLTIKLVPEPKLESEDNTGVYLIDNIRFFAGEESKDATEREQFAKELASLGEIFINDAFADYRESASCTDIAQFLPSYLGPLFYREISALERCKSPEHPYTVILGGAKLSEKVDLMQALLPVADKILVGGAMTYTLMKAKGLPIGNSRLEEDKIAVAQEMLQTASDKIVLPVDHKIIDRFGSEYIETLETVNEIPEGKVAVDIGPRTIELFKEHIQNAKTVLWNGPVGVYEWPETAEGSKSVGRIVEQHENAFRVLGGGDTLVIIKKFGLANFTHVSTGGGAMLSFLTDEHFPTLEAIENSRKT